MNRTINVDLAEFGGEGVIVMAPPTVRRKVWFENKTGKNSRYIKDRDKLELESSEPGNFAIYTLLTFIKQAPFKTDDIEGFLSYTDMLDEKVEAGMGEKLLDRLMTEVNNISKGVCSPLPTSPATETPNSEVVSL